MSVIGSASAAAGERALMDEHVGFLLAQVGRAASRRFEAALTPLGIKPRATCALLLLRRDGAMSQQALGDALDVDASNLVGLLNGLEDDGLVTRRRDPADRRRHVVAISERGTRRVTAVDAAAARADDAFLGPLDEDEREQLRRLLRRLAHGTELPPPDAVTAGSG